jgi:hypothetical protein
VFGPLPLVDFEITIQRFLRKSKNAKKTAKNLQKYTVFCNFRHKDSEGSGCRRFLNILYIFNKL